jgi:hypothetical protein
MKVVFFITVQWKIFERRFLVLVHQSRWITLQTRTHAHTHICVYILFIYCFITVRWIMYVNFITIVSSRRLMLQTHVYPFYVIISTCILSPRNFGTHTHIHTHTHTQRKIESQRLPLISSINTSYCTKTEADSFGGTAVTPEELCKYSATSRQLIVWSRKIQHQVLDLG